MYARYLGDKKAPRDAGGFARRVRYICRWQHRGAGVAAARLTNIHDVQNHWPDGIGSRFWPHMERAIAQGEICQVQNQRAQTDINYHLLFSFRPGELPTPEQIRICEDRLVDVLGFSEHQRVSAVHHDTDIVHVHVVINRIHPKTLRAANPWGDVPRMDRVCAQLENEFDFEREYHLSRDNASVLLSELQALAPQLLAAETWDNVHALLDTQHIALERRGAGLVFRRDDETVKASDVHRELGRARWEARLGHHLISTCPTAACRVSSPLPRKAAAMETYHGHETLANWLRTNAAVELLAASSWEQLHAIADTYGVQLQRRGAGLVLLERDTNTAVKASSVDRDLSFPRLVRCLGDYKSPTRHSSKLSASANVSHKANNARLSGGRESVTAPAQSHYRCEPTRLAESGRALYARYKNHQQVHRALRHQYRAAQNRHLQQEEEKLRARASSFSKIVALLAGRAASQLAWRLFARDRLRRDRKQLRELHRQAGIATRDHFPLRRWIDWVRIQALQGDQDALRWLQARKRYEIPHLSAQLRVTGAIRGLWSPIDITRTGAVVYQSLDGDRIVAEPDALRTLGPSTPAALSALLRAAQHRYGDNRLQVTGSQDFKRRLAKAAAQDDLAVTFADSEIESLRIRYHERRRTQRPAQRPSTRPVPHPLSATVLRHIATTRSDHNVRSVPTCALAQGGLHGNQVLLPTHARTDMAENNRNGLPRTEDPTPEPSKSRLSR